MPFRDSLTDVLRECPVLTLDEPDPVLTGVRLGNTIWLAVNGPRLDEQNEVVTEIRRRA